MRWVIRSDQRERCGVCADGGAGSGNRATSGVLLPRLVLVDWFLAGRSGLGSDFGHQLVRCAESDQAEEGVARMPVVSEALHELM